MGVKKKRKLAFPLLCRIIPKIRFIEKVEMKKIFERGVVEGKLFSELKNIFFLNYTPGLLLEKL
jgi:hypothetical protein